MIDEAAKVVSSSPSIQKNKLLRKDITALRRVEKRPHGFNRGKQRMILRPGQRFCEKFICTRYPWQYYVAPTGAKTILFSAIVGRHIAETGSKTLVLAHRDERPKNQENVRVNPDISTSIFDSRVKSWEGHVTFAMVQTLSIEENLNKIPKITSVTDEAHMRQQSPIKEL